MNTFKTFILEEMDKDDKEMHMHVLNHLRGSKIEQSLSLPKHLAKHLEKHNFVYSAKHYKGKNTTSKIVLTNSGHKQLQHDADIADHFHNLGWDDNEESHRYDNEF